MASKFETDEQAAHRRSVERERQDERDRKDSREALVKGTSVSGMKAPLNTAAGPSVDTRVTQRPGAGQVGGELTAVQDLQREAVRIMTQIELFEALGRQIKTWATNLPDRYSAAPFGTKQLTAAVNNISEHHRQASVLREHLGIMRRSCDQAMELGNHIGAVQATGQTKAYTPQ